MEEDAAQGAPGAPEQQPTPMPQTMHKMRLCCTYLRHSGSVKHSYSKVGWSETAYLNHRSRYPQFRAMIDAALEAFAGNLHAKLSDAAFGREEWEDKPNVHALIQMNRAHNPELFAPQVRHQGSVNVYHTLVPMAQSLDQLPQADLPELEDVVDAEWNDLSDLAESPYIDEGE